MKKNPKNKPAQSDEDKQFPLPIYDKKDDIYSREKEESLEEEDAVNEEDKTPGTDLDIPGAELDDENELIGEEDEENNYYSLGGDNHEDLEEDKG